MANDQIELAGTGFPRFHYHGGFFSCPSFWAFERREFSGELTHLYGDHADNIAGQLTSSRRVYPNQEPS
jgi:hypothetical protein